MNSRFILSHTAYLKNQIPEINRPQILMAGRSNAGKSSLINALANRKNLARTSSSPGKTRSINFFHVRPEDFFLVDLPGYGYAKCSKKERNKWSKLINDYLDRGKNIHGLVLIIDSRIPPQTLDIELAGYAQNIDIELLPVLTKADKCNQKQRAKAQNSWIRLLPEACPPILFSAQSGLGKDKLWQKILNLTDL